MKVKSKFFAIIAALAVCSFFTYYNILQRTVMGRLLSSGLSNYDDSEMAITSTPTPTAFASLGGKRRRKRILVYTSLFGALPWWYIPYSYNFTDFDGTPCDVYDCDVTYDRKALSSSDLVLFYGRDLPSAEHLKEISRNERPINQIWLFYMHESPMFSYFDTKKYSGIFNWTASYRSDSDVVITYHFYKQLKEVDERPKANHNFAKGKINLATWVNSHCDDDRINFLNRLRQHMPVDVYGFCSKKFKPQTPDCPRSSKQCAEIQKQYKFYIALENSFCKDYITEKYWLNSLEAGLVPVVVGFGDYNNSKIAIPGSFIDAQKFKSIKELADYLKYLDKNDTAYNEYHKWRYKYKLYYHHCMCEFCHAVQELKLPQKTIDLEEIWGKKNCDLEKKPLKLPLE